MRRVGIFLLLFLLTLWYTAAKDVEDAVARTAQWVWNLASSIVGGGADRIFDYLDAHAAPQTDVARYLGYWSAVAIAIVLVASMLREFVLTFLALLPSWASVRVSSRYRRGNALASRLVTDTHLARSVITERRTPADLGWRQRLTWHRARRLVRPTPAYRLARWARFEYAVDRLLSAAMSLFRAFGGVFLRIPGFSTALRPGVVVLSTYLVVSERPLRHQWGWITQQVADAWDWVTSPVPGRLLPILVLTLGVIFVGVSPLVDHIRARDEAAKDTNRLLGEFLGRLDRLNRVLWEWKGVLHENRWRLVVHWVEESTAHEYTWRYPSGGIEPAEPRRGMYHGRHDPNVIEQYSELDGRAQSISEEIAAIERRLEDNGLHHVAVRLTWRVRTELTNLGLLRGIGDLPLQSRLPLPSELYPEVVDGPEDEGGVPSRLIKTDRPKAEKEGTPCRMFAGSPSGRTTRVASRSMISRARALAG